MQGGEKNGTYHVVREFFREVMVWLHEYYDTELFKGLDFEYIKESGEDINELYRNIHLILGITYRSSLFTDA
jgi:hypothetical protein